MAKRKPTAIVRLDRGRLSPVSAFDAELIDAMPNGQEFDIVPRSKRSGAHNSLYWVQLGRIVKATEAFPTPEHMHRWLKVRLGYTEAICDPSGKPIAFIPESTGFDKMTQAEFNVYHEKALQLIAQEMGIDMAEVMQ
jgi:hypothetical protein